jgi:hypothetical protein
VTVVKVRRKAKWRVEVRVQMRDGQSVVQSAEVRADTVTEAMDDQDVLDQVAWSALEAQVEEADVVALSISLVRWSPR